MSQMFSDFQLCSSFGVVLRRSKPVPNSRRSVLISTRRRWRKWSDGLLFQNSGTQKRNHKKCLQSVCFWNLLSFHTAMMCVSKLCNRVGPSKVACFPTNTSVDITSKKHSQCEACGPKHHRLNHPPPKKNGDCFNRPVTTGDRKEPQQNVPEPRKGAAREGTWLSTAQQQGFVGKLNGDGKVGCEQ